MPDMEHQLSEWRAQLVNSGINAGEVVDELETHLREELARLESSGISDHEKFQLATSRLGDIRKLGREFQKASGRRFWGYQNNPLTLKILAAWLLFAGLNSVALLGFYLRIAFVSYHYRDSYSSPGMWEIVLFLLVPSTMFVMQILMARGLMFRRTAWLKITKIWLVLFALLAGWNLLVFRTPFLFAGVTGATGQYWLWFGFILLPKFYMYWAAAFNTLMPIWGLWVLRRNSVRKLFNQPA